jgi:hypothetical protein
MPFGIKKRTFVLSELMAINAEGGSARCDVRTETAGTREASACKFETFDKLSDGTSGAGRLGGAAAGNVLHSNACFLLLALRGGGGDSSMRGGAKILFRLASIMVGFRSSFSVVLGGIGPKEDSLSLLLNVLISGHAARMDLNPAQTLGGHHLPCGGNCCRA